MAVTIEGKELTTQELTDHSRILTISSFSQKEEIGRIVETYRKLPFYKTHDYQVYLPSFLRDFPLAKNFRDIIHVPSASFSYEDAIRTLENSRPKIEKGLNRLNNYPLWGFHRPKQYILKVTKWGVGGSYDEFTGLIIENIMNILRTDRDPAETPLHEIIHIGVEYLVNRYRLSHGEKEILVDLLFSHALADMFPNYISQNHRFPEAVGISKFITADSLLHIPQAIKDYVSTKS